MRTTVASLDYVNHGTVVRAPGAQYLSVQPSVVGRRLRGWSPALYRLIKGVAGEANIVHSHALWMMPGIYARQAAERFGKPLVISPRGMLDPWSLARGRLKKVLAAWAYENRNLRDARLLHATSEAEAESIRNRGLNQPIAVLPNGVELPAGTGTSAIAGREFLEQRFPALHGRRWLLFLGRLDPKKGLDLLLELWRELGPRFPDWRLLVAGPDLGGFGAGAVSMVAGDPVLRERTTFTGMLEGMGKSVALAHSDLFALPTRGENFGIAIAEALAHGTPVITTTAAPWAELVERDCGWWVAPNTEALCRALECGLRLSGAELASMGERGRALVAERYAWNSIGERWIEVYRWLLSGGAPPVDVRVG